MKALVPSGNMKFGRRQYVVGTSGEAKVVSRQTKITPNAAAATAET